MSITIRQWLIGELLEMYIPWLHPRYRLRHCAHRAQQPEFLKALQVILIAFCM